MRPPLLLFSAATLFLLGSVVAVILGQLEANALAPWLSLGYSLGAVICTVASLAWNRT